MQAIIIKQQSNAKNMAPQKETVQTLAAVSTLDGREGLQVVCEARFYMARSADGAGRVYCSLWVHGTQYTSGHGQAGGYGYHKQSSALACAIKSAGIELTSDIAGVGNQAMQDAMKAIAIAAGADAGNLLIVG